MTDIAREKQITNQLMLNHLNMWDEFDIKSVDDTKTVRYYNRIMNHINDQLDAGVKWLDTDEAQKYFKGESQYHQEVFQSLEDEWDSILESKYDSVEALLDEVYRRGKAKGYTDMREHVRYTEADKQALRIATEYNYHLINKIDNDVRNEIKNKIISGFLAGDNPNVIAPKIQAIAGEQLEGSTFTPRQRATMIAKTEISRVQNTGILQSYINEGYTEVKILTAEDDNVCHTCLTYAYEFNKKDEVTYQNAGKEKIHNIIELVKNGSFPPFHPLCRCTYLSVWKTKTNPPKKPYVINLTPMKFLDYENKFVLPDGKPNIKWTKENLYNQLKGFTDDQNELEVLTKFLMNYMKNIKNRNIEYLNAIDNDFNIVCNQFSLGESGGVDLCHDGIDASKNIGLLAIIHNHPSNNPLHSQGDIDGFAVYDIKYSFIFTEENGLYVIKNDGENSNDIQNGWNGFYNDMLEDYKENKSLEYGHLLDMYIYGGLDEKIYNTLLRSKVKKHISNNISLSLNLFKHNMIKHNIPVFHSKP